MLDTALQRIGILGAILAGLTTIISPMLEQLSAVRNLALWITASIAAILFLRMLFDRRISEGLHVAHLKMYGKETLPDRRIAISDPEWGLFGKAAGSRLLLWVRAIFVLGVIPIMFIHQWIGFQGILLWLCGAFVAMELSILHVGLSHSSQN